MAVITIKRWLLAFIIATMWYVWSSDKHWLNKQTFQCGAWINILRDHAEKRHPDGWILASEHPQNRVLCTGECLIRTNIYTSDMSSKTRYFPLIPVSDSWDHSCFPAASCFSLSVAWTRRAGDGPRVTWGKCAPTVKPNLLKRGSSDKGEGLSVVPEGLMKAYLKVYLETLESRSVTNVGGADGTKRIQSRIWKRCLEHQHWKTSVFEGTINVLNGFLWEKQHKRKYLVTVSKSNT